jgi:hypothetical protein
MKVKKKGATYLVDFKTQRSSLKNLDRKKNDWLGLVTPMSFSKGIKMDKLFEVRMHLQQFIHLNTIAKRHWWRRE